MRLRGFGTEDFLNLSNKMKDAAWFMQRWESSEPSKRKILLLHLSVSSTLRFLIISTEEKIFCGWLIRDKMVLLVDRYYHVLIKRLDFSPALNVLFHSLFHVSRTLTTIQRNIPILNPHGNLQLDVAHHF